MSFIYFDNNEYKYATLAYNEDENLYYNPTSILKELTTYFFIKLGLDNEISKRIITLLKSNNYNYFFGYKKCLEEIINSFQHYNCWKDDYFL